MNTANAGGSYTIVKVPCLPNTTYRVKVDVITGPPVVIVVETIDGYDNLISTKYFMDGSFLTEANARSVRISIYRVDAGVLEVKNPTLTIGSESKPFKPREDAMLALQTDLYADPLTGANADEVFEKGGQYFKLAKWKRFELNGTISYVFLNNYTGFKRVTIPVGQLPLPYIPGNVQTAWSYKYDGSVLNAADTAKVPNALDYSETYGWLFSVSSADSGWGDAYNPTADEIKAYFMGWIMYLSGTGGSGKSGITPYNGTGTKYWARVASDGNTLADGTSVLPTTQALNFTPYQLVYQLATPTVEPITSEGQLTLFEGSNQVEVGTGVVFREKATTRQSGSGPTGNWYIAETAGTGSRLKYVPRKILTVFKYGKIDTKWTHQDWGTTLQGKEFVQITNDNYDRSATYMVTYFMLDSFPAAPFVGTVAENEKALLTDMNYILRQNAAALSVVEAAVNEVEAVRKQNKRNVWGRFFNG
ncbi:hypothetical protein N6H13_10405 [Paenibacillus sp. CC-CFT742]|nr:hypothetical protein [Paenibacillus sp. CC-CFT742]WJH30948.1 hypothetical protein N6H13_10405 [Paenibacillus sp. CC-CFT742]